MQKVFGSNAARCRSDCCHFLCSLVEPLLSTNVIEQLDGLKVTIIAIRFSIVQ